MKMTSSKLLNLEHIIIEEIHSKLNLNFPAIPIEDNLSLFYSVLKSHKSENSLAIRMQVKTIKETQLQFSAAVMFIFSIKDEKVLEEENKRKLIATMVSISYSTLRGILLKELPVADVKNMILPVIDLPILLKAQKKKNKKK